MPVSLDKQRGNYPVKQFFKDASTATVVAIVAGLLAIIVFLVVGFIGVYGYGWFTDHTADRSGRTQVKQQTNGNGQYRIAAYNHFYDLCASVQTDEASITNLQDELKTTTDPTRKAVLPASITGLKNKRADDINTYNADARKSYTLGQFRASDLPFQLDPTEDHTTCSAS